MTTGLLKSPKASGYETWDPQNGRRVHYGSGFSIDPRQPLSSNLHRQPTGAMCFADIPLEDLSLHAAKYSSFALAFRKDFLVSQGANPVFYIARRAVSDRPGQTRTRVPFNISETFSAGPIGPPVVARPDGLSLGDLFDRLAKVLDDAQWKYLYPTERRGTFAAMRRPTEEDPLREAAELLEWYIFAFFKFFDHDLADADPENYYMEREWRVLGAVTFSLSDVERVLLPRGFADRFRTTFPEYSGQVSFLDGPGRAPS
jgi:hypothetical protein